LAEANTPHLNSGHRQQHIITRGFVLREWTCMANFRRRNWWKVQSRSNRKVIGLAWIGNRIGYRSAPRNSIPWSEFLTTQSLSLIIILFILGSNPTQVYTYFICMFDWNNGESKKRLDKHCKHAT
jgi:hypothetical protein